MTSELAKKKLLDARKMIDEIDSKLVDGLNGVLISLIGLVF